VIARARGRVTKPIRLPSLTDNDLSVQCILDEIAQNEPQDQCCTGVIELVKEITKQAKGNYEGTQ
jgi:hypothetical protein